MCVLHSKVVSAAESLRTGLGTETARGGLWMSFDPTRFKKEKRNSYAVIQNSGDFQISSIASAPFR